MPFNYLGRVYHNWQQTFPDLPFIEDLRRAFHNTWVGYNTELFQPSWIDKLTIDVELIDIATRLGGESDIVNYNKLLTKKNSSISII